MGCFSSNVHCAAIEIRSAGIWVVGRKAVREEMTRGRRGERVVGIGGVLGDVWVNIVDMAEAAILRHYIWKGKRCGKKGHSVPTHCRRFVLGYAILS